MEKLLVYLKTFSTDEMREFIAFVGGKSKTKLSLFLEYLEKNHPVFPPKKMEKEVIAQKLFASKCTRIINNLTTRLMPFVKEFVIQKELEYCPIEKDRLFLKALKRRQLGDKFFKEAEKAEKNCKKEETMAGIERFHDLSQIQRMCLNHPNFGGEKILLETKKLIHAIDVYYFATKLYLGASLLNSGYAVKDRPTDLDALLYPVSELVAFVKDKEIGKIPQIKLLSQIFESLKNKNFKDKKFLKDEFINSIELYTKGEKSDIVSFLSQIFFEDYKSGTKGSLVVLHELNSFSVNRGIVLEDGYIAADLFQNIVSIACAVKEFEWAEEFIKDYSTCLKKTDRSDTYLICKAKMHLNKKEYDKVIKTLKQRHFDTEYNGAIARMRKLQAYFHLDNDEDFDNLIHSFREFLSNRVKLSECLDRSFRNFIIFIRKLYDSKYMQNICKTKLKKNIEDCSQIVSKSWLLEQL